MFVLNMLFRSVCIKEMWSESLHTLPSHWTCTVLKCEQNCIQVSVPWKAAWNWHTQQTQCPATLCSTNSPIWHKCLYNGRGNMKWTHTANQTSTHSLQHKLTNMVQVSVQRKRQHEMDTHTKPNIHPLSAAQTRQNGTNVCTMGSNTKLDTHSKSKHPPTLCSTNSLIWRSQGPSWWVSPDQWHPVNDWCAPSPPACQPCHTAGDTIIHVIQHNTVHVCVPPLPEGQSCHTHTSTKTSHFIQPVSVQYR